MHYRSTPDPSPTHAVLPVRHLARGQQPAPLTTRDQLRIAAAAAAPVVAGLAAALLISVVV